MDNGLASCEASPLNFLAEWTGLEPATPGVTGRCQKSMFMRVCGPQLFQNYPRCESSSCGLERAYSKVRGSVRAGQPCQGGEESQSEDITYATLGFAAGSWERLLNLEARRHGLPAASFPTQS